MARGYRKKSDWTVDEILSKLPNRYKKASSLSKAEARAQEFQSELPNNNNEALDLFKKCPEWFLFDDWINGVKIHYKGVYVQDSRFDDFASFLSRLQEAAKKLYKDMLSTVNITQTDKKHRKTTQDVESIISDDIDLNDLDAPLERPGNIPKKISAEISKIFAQDDTSVYTFTYMQTSIGRYLDKKGVQTVGQYLKRIKEDSSFRTEQCREEGYAEFRENLFVYFARNEEWQALQAKKVLKDKPSKDIQEKKTAQPKAKKLETIEKIEDLQTFDAERFKEGSKEMEKINDIIKEYQYKMVRSFMDEGMDAAEVEQFLDDEIEKAKKLIAQKRKELERGVALGQMIKKINDTKYKRNPNMKEEGHMYNPFGTDDFGI